MEKIEIYENVWIYWEYLVHLHQETINVKRRY